MRKSALLADRPREASPVAGGGAAAGGAEDQSAIVFNLDGQLFFNGRTERKKWVGCIALCMYD